MADLRFAQLMRLIWIDAHLAHGRALNRSDLMDGFAISQPQAATDLKEFKRRHPGRMEYHAGAKCHLPVGDPIYPADMRMAVYEARACVRRELERLSDG